MSDDRSHGRAERPGLRAARQHGGRGQGVSKRNPQEEMLQAVSVGAEPQPGKQASRTAREAGQRPLCSWQGGERLRMSITAVDVQSEQALDGPGKGTQPDTRQPRTSTGTAGTAPEGAHTLTPEQRSGSAMHKGQKLEPTPPPICKDDTEVPV